MLSSHPNIVITRHTSMWTRYYERFGDLSGPGNFERCLSAMLQSKTIQAFNPDAGRIRREFCLGPASYGRLFGLFHEHNAERLAKPRWGDQSGSIERFADPIFAAFPGARIIHMIRDPRDRYRASASSPASLKRAERPNTVWGRSRTVFGRSAKVGWETANWLFSWRLAMRNRSRYPDRYKVLRYEALISDPDSVIREICRFVHEDFEPGILTPEGEQNFGKEGDPQIDPEETPGAEGRTWRGGGDGWISKREIALIQAYAGQEMLACDYLPEPIQLSIRDRLIYHLVDWPAGMAGMGVRHTWRTPG
jgi:hypothetical protein